MTGCIGNHEEVDVFVREDEVYVCGRNRMQEPPDDPAHALPEASAAAFLQVKSSRNSRKLACMI